MTSMFVQDMGMMEHDEYVSAVLRRLGAFEQMTVMPLERGALVERHDLATRTRETWTLFDNGGEFTLRRPNVDELALNVAYDRIDGIAHPLNVAEWCWQAMTGREITYESDISHIDAVLMAA